MLRPKKPFPLPAIKTVDLQPPPPHHWLKAILLGGVFLPLAAFIIVASWQRGSVEPIFAGKTYLQAVNGSVSFATHVQAEFLKDPLPGNLLVAVVVNRDAARAYRPPGWEEAINESGYSPGQAIFYKIASEGTPRAVNVLFDRRGDFGLQIFEYPGIDPEHPLDTVISDAGRGRAIHTGTLNAGPGEHLFFAAAVTDRAGTFDSQWENDFAMRNLSRKPGGGALLWASADRLGSEGNISSATLFNLDTRWRGQMVAFNLLPGDRLTSASPLDLPTADLSLFWQTDQSAPHEQSSVDLALTVSNAGPNEATALQVSLPLPSGENLVSANVPPGTAYQPGLGLWRVPDLAVGDSTTLNLKIRFGSGIASTSIINKAEILVSDQLDEREENNLAYAIFDLDPQPTEEVACPTLGDPWFKIENEAGAVRALSAALDGNAVGATYWLVSEDPRRQTGEYRSLDAAATWNFDPPAGEKTLYAWFGNYCRSTFVISQTVVYEPPSPPDPAAEIALFVAPDSEEAFTVAVPETELPAVAVTELESEPTAPAAPVANVSAACPAPRLFDQFLSLDSLGQNVRDLQAALQCLGYFPADQPTTAIFGPITKTAVQAFQAAQGIDPVGYVGPATNAALNRLLLPSTP